jgi:hypothetical protein
VLHERTLLVGASEALADDLALEGVPLVEGEVLVIFTSFVSS